MERLILVLIGAVILIALAACLAGIVTLAVLCIREWRERQR